MSFQPPIHHFLLGGTGRSRGPLEAVPMSIPGIWIRIVMGERIFVVTLDTLGLFFGRFFLKAWKRNISQSSWKAKEHDTQIGKTKPFFTLILVPIVMFFLWAKYRCVFKMFCFILFGTRVFLQGKPATNYPQYQISPPPPPPKKWKIIQYNNIHLQISCVFHCQKRQWNFVSVVGVY